MTTTTHNPEAAEPSRIVRARRRLLRAHEDHQSALDGLQRAVNRRRDAWPHAFEACPHGLSPWACTPDCPIRQRLAEADHDLDRARLACGRALLDWHEAFELFTIAWTDHAWIGDTRPAAPRQ